MISTAVGWAKRLVRRSSKSEGGSVPTICILHGEMVGTALCAFVHPTGSVQERHSAAVSRCTLSAISFGTGGAQGAPRRRLTSTSIQ